MKRLVKSSNWKTINERQFSFTLSVYIMIEYSFDFYSFFYVIQMIYTFCHNFVFMVQACLQDFAIRIFLRFNRLRFNR